MSPLVAAAAIPFGVALALLLLVRLVPSLRALPELSGLSVGLALVAAYIALEGVPPLVPVASKQKLPLIVGAAAAVALLFRKGPERMWPVVVGLVVALALSWIGIRRLPDPAALGFVLAAALWAGASTWLYSRLDQKHGALGVSPTLLLIALGLAAVALLGASASLAFLAGGLAAGLGAFSLVALVAHLVGKSATLPVASRLGTTGLFASLGAMTALTAILVWFTPRSDQAAIGVLAALPLFAWLGSRIKLGETRLSSLTRPLWAFLLSVVPVGIALALATRAS